MIQTEPILEEPIQEHIPEEHILEEPILEEVKERKEYIKPGVKRRKEIQHASFMQYVRDLHSK